MAGIFGIGIEEDGKRARSIQVELGQCDEMKRIDRMSRTTRLRLVENLEVRGSRSEIDRSNFGCSHFCPFFDLILNAYQSIASRSSSSHIANHGKGYQTDEEVPEEPSQESH